MFPFCGAHSALVRVATADRAEKMIWQSPAAARIRRKAEQLGFTEQTDGNYFRSFQPEDNASQLQRAPSFILGRFDRIVPLERSEPVLHTSRQRFGNIDVRLLPFGRAMTVILGSYLIQRRLSLATNSRGHE